MRTIVVYSNADVSPFTDLMDVWFLNWQNKVKAIRYSSSANVKQFFTDVGYTYLNGKIVTCDGEIIHGESTLDHVVTSPDKPLVIKPFCIWIEREQDSPKKHYCNPLTFISELFAPQGITHGVAYHKNRKVDANECAMKYSTSYEEPLVIKSFKVTIYINGKILPRDMIGCESIEGVIGDASAAVKCALISTAWDKDGVEVEDMSSFILNTTEETRILYLKKVEPDKPRYSHSHSVSDAARKHSNDIIKHSTSHKLYVRWFSMQIYNRYCSEPSVEAKEFAERLTWLMDIDSYKPKMLAHHESTYSAVFFRALDRFLFRDCKEGCVLHHPVLRQHGSHHSTPDGYISRLQDGLPSALILLSDVKKTQKTMIVPRWRV